MDTDSRSLGVVLTQPETGVGVKCLIGSTRLNPIQYLSDLAPCLEITFRGENPTFPANLYATLETLDTSTKPGIRKKIPTQSVATTSASNLPDGWKVLRLPFEGLTVITDNTSKEQPTQIRIGDGKSPNITADDIIERVQIWGTSPGAFEVRNISLVRTRNVSVALKNPYAKNLENLEIEGCTANPSATVVLKLVDASGKSSTKTVTASEGKYQLTWNNPPLTPGKSNSLHASVDGGKNPLDQAVPREVFGFLRDTSHVWLKTKGRDIVTSSSSKGGERPFYAVGVGYGKNVLVRGYDEEAAAYCQSMGLNTLRLAFYTTNFNNKPEVPLNFEDITAYIDPVLEAAKRHELYVILDDHSYFKNEIAEETARGEQKSANWTEERFQNWVNRWVQVADYYKDEPYVLGYELCNEPVCAPETARKWYTRCVKAIRKVDKRHIVLVGTNNWSHSRAMERTWEGVADKIDAPYNNVVFSFHDYPLDDNPWIVQSTLRAFQAKYNVPVMCTEFGGGGKPECVVREFQAGMMSLFSHDRISWMIWSLYYDKTRAIGFPTKVVKIEGEKSPEKAWEIQSKNPGYWIPYVELWAPTARIMGTPFPEPASSSASSN